MPTPLPPVTRVPLWYRRIFAFAALSLLAGCANADFGEVNPTLARDDIHDWIGPYAAGEKRTMPSPMDLVSGKKRDFALTDDERQLRDLAYPLIEPPYDRQKWYSVAGEYGVYGYDKPKAFDRTIYAKRLLGDYFRSPASRYAQLIDDIRNDATRLPQFFETAARVLDADQKRREGMAIVSSLSKVERHNAVRRMNENVQIVGLVNAKLDQRVSSYHFALERLVIKAPSAQAADAELALDSLRGEIEYYRGQGAPTWVRERSLAAAR